MSDERAASASDDALHGGHGEGAPMASAPDEVPVPVEAAPVEGPVSAESDAAAGGDAAPAAVGGDAPVEKIVPADFSAVAAEWPDRGGGLVSRPVVYENERDDAKPISESAEDAEEVGEKRWYILKVQSNREESIKEGLIRRVKIAGLDRYFGEVFIPTEMVTEFKNGKKRIVKRKLYPGYIMVQMAVNDESWFLVRDTPGIGDFTGAGGRPAPMPESEVNRLIRKEEEKTEEAPKLKIAFKVGDRVKINEGTFENFEGEVHNIDQANGRVTVMINIFGRSTPVELEYWQIENL